MTIRISVKVLAKPFLFAAATLFALQLASAQVVASGTDPLLTRALEQIERLANQVAAQEVRIHELEAERPGTRRALSSATVAIVPAVSTHASPAAESTAPSESAPPSPAPQMETDVHDHMVELPGGGPTLKIRGFLDLDFGLGTNSNPLIYPLPPEGRSTFQAGEFDLFFSSKLSRKLSFVGEVIIGSDATNEWGIDIERLQLTYKASRYLEISGGRYHTSVGYYNTAFHHGTWFQTAGGRPFMYFFEDSGGILPVHGVGVTTTGLVPGTESLGLHWIAEVSNGHAANPDGPAVQNFASDKTSKAYNLAAYIRPSWAPGLQIGGSYYRDRQYPLGSPRVDQRIASTYLVYNNSIWEFLGEGVLLTNTLSGTGCSYNSPLSYAQISR
jgi:hypothetical protein